MTTEVGEFESRHLGDGSQIASMLKVVGAASLDALIEETIPTSVRATKPLALPAPASEAEALAELGDIAKGNQVFKSYIGCGYYGTFTPSVILRNILHNPSWYTAYTPYQAEIAQGRLEALLNFQTMVADLTGLPIANASLLDEGTAAAEAMNVLRGSRSGRTHFFIAHDVNPTTIAVVTTRARALGVEVEVGDASKATFGSSSIGVLLQYPATDGRLTSFSPVAQAAHAAGAGVVVATDLLALTLFKPPGELGADIAVGSSQRFGVPMGFGGPHAAFIAVSAKDTRALPGRIIGMSEDAEGKPALRMALQTREQHIRRERATSNICTAQVLLAVMASMYAVYHGPVGLRRIATRVHGLARRLAARLSALGFELVTNDFFDTVAMRGEPSQLDAAVKSATDRRMNFRRLDAKTVSIALDETTSATDVEAIAGCFAGLGASEKPARDIASPTHLARTTPFLTHPVFQKYHTEHEMLRYLKRLEAKDLSLSHSMIPLGSCTMKLNAASELTPISWPEFADLHPLAPREQWSGYQAMLDQLRAWLCEITGMAACSLMPNSGAQGEYAGLLAIQKYHQARGQGGRKICLIPASAHGTNPASAMLAGLNVVVVATDAKGDIDLADMKAKISAHANDLAALMVTYPSTHGVFETGLRTAIDAVHGAGGQVYLDGANMNAQVGLCRPGDFGADVCHLNLHKTFAIPHGGGGPGMGPICVAPHLAAYLPAHLAEAAAPPKAVGAVSSAPFGSASILPISWMYIRMLGAHGLSQSTRLAILNANYVAQRLNAAFPVLYRGEQGRVGHECIVDLRKFKATSGVEAEDVAKRLIDYGFHAPTVSFPVSGTLMIEPTESESKEELDRFCDAMLSIFDEISEIENGKLPRDDNPLKRAPHTAQEVCADAWKHGYSRERAAFPLPWVRERKFWPSCARINSVQGDRHLIAVRPPTW